MIQRTFWKIKQPRPARLTFTIILANTKITDIYNDCSLTFKTRYKNK